MNVYVDSFTSMLVFQGSMHFKIYFLINLKLFSKYMDRLINAPALAILLHKGIFTLKKQLPNCQNRWTDS